MQHVPWQQFLVILIAFGAPAASWIFGKMREQYQKKRQADIRKVREEESIRVQRPAERIEQVSPQTQAQRRMEELAARRQAQLEELRRRRAQATERTTPDGRPVIVLAPTTPPTSSGPAQGPMRPGVPGTPMRMPVPAPMRPGAPQAPPATPRPARPQAQPPTVRQRPQPRPAPARITTPSEPEPRPTGAPRTAPAVVAASPMTGPQTRAFHAAKTPGALARAMLLGRGASPTTTVATAFALTEILSKPVSLRENTFGDHA